METRRSRIGHCGETEYDAHTEQRCEHKDSGAWRADRVGIRNLADCAIHCINHCPRCNFVSFSREHNDCSWYWACPRARQTFDGAKFRSLQVRTLKLPPPPPPPAHDMPPEASSGYCSLMGPDLGDCLHSEQGSWPGVKSPAECVARCQGCSRCAYVSFTTANVTETDAPRQPQGVHPPHWWRCRWFSTCDLDDLRRSPPAHEPWQYATVRVSEPGSNRTRRDAGMRPRLRLGLVALLESPPGTPLGGGPYIGGMVQWCQNARRLAGVLPQWRVDQLLLGGGRELARLLASEAGCVELRHVPVDHGLRHLAMSCVEKLQYWQPVFFQGVNLFKWQLLAMRRYDVLVFADIDLELMPIAEHPSGWVGATWHAALARMARQSRIRLLADPDVYSPINGGLMLVKPAPHIYQDGLQVLRSCRFNATHGWEHVGMRPSLVGGHISPFLESRRAWDFGGAGTEQGFIFYMLWMRHRVGAYGARDRKSLPLSRHWWAGVKPWADIRAQEDIVSARIDWPLGRLYDFTMRESVGGHEGALAIVPRLVAQQRAVRRAIESHQRFGDLFDLWQAQAWSGDGFVFHVTLPASATTGPAVWA